MDMNMNTNNLNNLNNNMNINNMNINNNTNIFVEDYKDNLPEDINIDTIIIVPYTSIYLYIEKIKLRYPNFKCTFFTYRKNPNYLQISIINLY